MLGQLRADERRHAQPAHRDTATLVKNAARGWYLPPNRLLYVMQDGAAMLVGFDPDAMVMKGTPRQVFSDVASTSPLHPSSRSAPTAARSSTSGASTPGASDRCASSGSTRRPAHAARLHLGRCVQLLRPLARRNPSGADVFSEERQNLWVKTLDRGPITRLTFEGALNYRPRLAGQRPGARVSSPDRPARFAVRRACGRQSASRAARRARHGTDR
jgi:hypothetical protein